VLRLAAVHVHVNVVIPPDDYDDDDVDDNNNKKYEKHEKLYFYNCKYVAYVDGGGNSDIVIV
jgi:hypothetical protein